MKWIQADKQRIAAEKRAEGIESGSAPSTPSRSVVEEEKKADTPMDQQALIHESNEYVDRKCDEFCYRFVLCEKF